MSFNSLTIKPTCPSDDLPEVNQKNMPLGTCHLNLHHTHLWGDLMAPRKGTGVAECYLWSESSGDHTFPPTCGLLSDFGYIHKTKYSAQFRLSVVSDSLRPHGLQHPRPPCPSSTPGVYSNSCPLSSWCHPTISSSITLSTSCPQSFAGSGLFQWVTSLHQGTKVLELQFQHQSFQWIFRLDFL